MPKKQLSVSLVIRLYRIIHLLSVHVAPRKRHPGGHHPANPMWGSVALQYTTKASLRTIESYEVHLRILAHSTA